MTYDQETEKRFTQASHLYDHGHFEKAFHEFLALARLGDVSAMTRVAEMYGGGKGTKYDFDESIAWDMRAAELGSPTALINLGISYRNSGDARRARAWFEKAIKIGDGEAAFELARIYLVSDLETERVKEYLALAVRSESISEASREEAKRLLGELKAV